VTGVGRAWKTWQLLTVAVVAMLLGVGVGASGSAGDRTARKEAERKLSSAQSENEALTVKSGADRAALEAVQRAATTTVAPTTTRGTTGIIALPTTVPVTLPVAKAWAEVFSLTGSSEKRGDNFHLTGGNVQARLRYKSSAGVFGVYVVRAGDSLEKSGGFTEVSCSEACDDQTRLVKAGGDYYLDVKTSRGSWSVVIEEMR